MKKNILIVDDEEDIVKLLTTIFELEEYEVHSAKDGEEALKIARLVHPGVMLLDVQIPLKNGYEVCKEIKSDIDLSDTKVLMITGMVQNYDREKAEDARADALINKPFRSQVLVEKVEGLLNNTLIG